MQKLNQRVINEIEKGICDQGFDAEIVEAELTPYESYGAKAAYPISIEYDANVISNITYQGERRDVDDWDETDYQIDLIVKGVTHESESATIVVDYEQCEVTLLAVKGAKFDYDSDVTIENSHGFEYVDEYIEEIEDPSNWDEEYINELNIKEFTIPIDPDVLFEE